MPRVPIVEKSNGYKPSAKSSSKSTRSIGKRSADSKDMRKAGKRPRVELEASIHIPKDALKQDLVANYKNYFKSKPKGTNTNLYQMAPVGSQISVQSMTQNYQVFYSASKSQLNTALQTTSMNTAVTGNVVNTTNIFWEKYKQEFLFTNTTNATCIVRIKHYTAKDDTVSSFASQWIGGMMDQQGNTTDNSLIYGVEPEMSQRLTQFWRKTLTKEYTLAPGATLKHLWVNNLDKMINNQMLLDSDNYMRDVTQCMLVLVRGTAATDQVNVSLVDTTPVKLDVIQTGTVSYTYVEDSTTNLLFAAGSGTGAINNVVKVVNTLGVDPTQMSVVAVGY